jgi:lipoprotein-anchoring transpeptidase ErfK/SrfK
MRTYLLAACALPLLAGCDVNFSYQDDPQAKTAPPGNSAGGAQAGSGTAPAPAPAVPETTQQLRVLVDISDRELRLFDGQRLAQRHPVAVGTKRWPTPTGSWNIHQVDINPEWVPPRDEEWAKDEKTTGPGDPDNPLGRARLVYRKPNTIHGTNDLESVGTAASHGSIRVTNDVVLQLAQTFLKAGGSWRGDQWFQGMTANRTREFEIKLQKPIPIIVQE